MARLIATRVPVFGKLLVEMEMGKFMRTLAILVSNHVDIIRTVRIATRVIQNQVIRASFSNLEGRLRGGEKLSAGLSGNPFVPPAWRRGSGWARSPARSARC